MAGCFHMMSLHSSYQTSYRYVHRAVIPNSGSQIFFVQQVQRLNSTQTWNDRVQTMGLESSEVFSVGLLHYSRSPEDSLFEQPLDPRINFQGQQLQLHCQDSSISMKIKLQSQLHHSLGAARFCYRSKEIQFFHVVIIFMAQTACTNRLKQARCIKSRPRYVQLFTHSVTSLWQTKFS